jgi:hypothetical protein
MFVAGIDNVFYDKFIVQKKWIRRCTMDKLSYELIPHATALLINDMQTIVAMKGVLVKEESFFVNIYCD